MQRFWSWLAVELGKRAGLVALVGLILTLVLGFGITRLEFATGQDSYLNKDDEVYIENVAYQDLFGGQAMLGLITMDDGHTIDELFDADGITQFRSLHDDLMADDAYVSVVTPLTVLEYTDTLVQGGTPGGDPTRGIAGTITLRALAAAEPGSDEATARQEDSVRTLERAGEIPPDERTIDNPDWIDFLLFDNTGAIRRSQLTFLNDPSHASIVVRLPGNLSIDDEGVLAVAAMERMNELSFPNATVTATGAPILLDDINHYLRGGMLMLGGIAVAIMTLILLVLFDVRWRLLPLAVILVGVVWAFGLAGYLGIPLTIVTIAGLPVMLGVGIDYAIQLHARVEEEVILDRSDHPMQETARNLGPALLVVTFDAIFAFLALRFAQVPMLRDFGLLLAVGIAVICLNSIVMPLAALGIREYRSPTTGRDFRQGALGRLTVWLGSLSQVWAIPLAVASVAIFIGGIAVEDDLQLQTDPIEWVDQSSQTVQDIHTIEDEVGTSGELGVFVETDDLYTNENLQWMHDFRIEQFDKFGPQSGAPRQLLTANSIEQVLSDITYLDGFGSIAPTGAEAELGWAVAPADIQASLVIPDGTAGNIVFRVSPGSIEDLAVIVNEVRDNIAPPEGTRATPSGLAVVGVGLLENLEANRVLLTYLAMLFVFLFLAVRLRSVIRALLSLVPVAIAVGAASLVAWIAGFNLSPMTAVGGPLVIATCTEFTSLILLRFVEERARGIEPQEAVDVVAGRTGRAFIVSGLTAIAGIAVLSFSSLPLLRDFGRVVAMNVTVALLSALVVLPPLLVWAERRGWVSRGLIKEPAPFIETPYEHAGPGTDTAPAPGS
ncbi:MAG: MMPL family transporter [Ilumatobacteraceae bacterium]